MSSAQTLSATRLSFGYDQLEDRLSVVASDASGRRLSLLMTRRLTGRLINSLARLLEQSSLAIRQAPADVKDDLILLEHQGALYPETGKGHTSALPAAEGMKRVEPQGSAQRTPPLVVTRVNVTAKPLGFDIVLCREKTELVALSLKRVELHRVLEAISRYAEAADWNITIHSKWLEPGQDQIVFN